MAGRRKAEEEETERGDRLLEVSASLAALIFLLAAEFLLFGFGRVTEDVADLVTLCAFGGIAAAVLRTSSAMFPGRRTLASAAIGLVAALAVVHGARPGAGSGKLAPTLGVTNWTHPAAIGAALKTFIIVTGVVGLLQFLSRRRLLLLPRWRLLLLAVGLLSLFAMSLVLVGASGPPFSIHVPSVTISGASAFTIHIPSVTISLGDSDTFQFVTIGLAAALIARLVVGHTAGFFLDLLIGMDGAFLSKWAIGAAGVSVGQGLVPQMIAALIGALVFMVVARTFGGKLVASGSEDEPERPRVEGAKVDADHAVGLRSWIALAIIAIGLAVTEAYRRRRRAV